MPISLEGIYTCFDIFEHLTSSIQIPLLVKQHIHGRENGYKFIRRKQMQITTHFKT
jgi:hypothetical protein